MSEQSLTTEAQEAILKRIAETAPTAPAVNLLRLSEAYAYAVSPSQPHGGSVEVSSK